MAMADITASEVLKAVEEFDRLGREAFLHAYGFHPARRYLLTHNGRLYDSKAIVGAAHGFLPGLEPLRAHAFSGGLDHAVGLLRELGFEVVDEAARGLELDELLGRLGTLRVNRAHGRPKFYQPITLLWAVGRARRGEERLLAWEETAEALGGLLERYGVREERPRPDYPVAALCRAGMWELRGHEGPVPSAHGDAALRRWFADNAPSGGLAQPVHEVLRRSGEARLAVIDALLTTYFEGLDYEPLLREVGLYDDGMAEDADDAQVEQPRQAVALAASYDRMCHIVESREDENRGRRTARTSRDPIRSAAARRAVLLRCDGRCENPGCTGQPADVTATGAAILEVDHVVDLAGGGRDHPSQMVALCPNCHAVKTRGRSREKLRAELLEVARETHARWSRRAES